MGGITEVMMKGPRKHTRMTDQRNDQKEGGEDMQTHEELINLRNSSSGRTGSIPE